MSSSGKGLSYKVAQVKDFKMRMQRATEGRKGRLAVTVEVFEVAPISLKKVLKKVGLAACFLNLKRNVLLAADLRSRFLPKPRCLPPRSQV